MNARAAWLTWKMHRFEVVAGAVLLGLVAMSAWVVATHLDAITVAPECWAQWDGPDSPTAACRRMVERWLDINEHEAGQLAGLLRYLPVAVGLILGAPIVARELELRTVTLAWSLERSRRRWLVTRIWPLAVVAVTGAIVVGIASSRLRMAQAASPYYSDLHIGDIASQGPVLASQVLLGFGIAVVVGAVLGRTLPGLVVAGLLAIGWIAFGGQRVEDAAAASHATHIVYADDGQYPVQPLDYLGEAYKEPNGHIVEGSLVDLVCGGFDEDGNTCPGYPPSGYQRMMTIIPLSAWQDIERAETAAGLGIGILAILLTFPVVARRRPG